MKSRLTYANTRGAQSGYHQRLDTSDYGELLFEHLLKCVYISWHPPYTHTHIYIYIYIYIYMDRETERERGRIACRTVVVLDNFRKGITAPVQNSLDKNFHSSNIHQICHYDWMSVISKSWLESYLQRVLTFWRRNYFLNFSTPCI